LSIIILLLKGEEVRGTILWQQKKISKEVCKAGEDSNPYVPNLAIHWRPSHLTVINIIMFEGASKRGVFRNKKQAVEFKIILFLCDREIFILKNWDGLLFEDRSIFYE
jgi:hypothetical protein